VTGSGCGRCGGADGQHTWVDQDCVLPHKGHSTRLLEGAHVCINCVDRHRDWLTEIVELFGTLHLLLVPPLSSGAASPDGDYEKPRKAPEAPVPVRLDVLAMLSDRARLFRTGRPSDLPDVPSVMEGWAQAFYEATYDGDVPGYTLAAAAAVLRANAEAMARLPIIDEFDAELRWVRSHLRRAHGISSPKPVGKCPTLTDAGTCGGPLWPDTTYGLRVLCGRCERVFDDGELRRLGQMLTYQKEAS
jgi:hypothetical protein